MNSQPNRNTPWGYSDSCTDIGQGILSVTTPGHGGYFVPNHLLKKIPPKHRAWAKRWSHSENWYEEDCCWAAVALAFPDLFTADVIERAAKVVQHYCTV